MKIDKIRRLELRWFEADRKITKATLMKTSLEDIIEWAEAEFPFLALEGGHVRYPGHPKSDTAVSVCVIKNHEHHTGGIVNRGERFTSFGADFKEGFIMALVTTNAMLNYRGQQ